VLELVEGPTLADRLARGPLPIPQALAIARQIAEALAAAHEKGIVHRDLKPANVVLDRGDTSGDVRAKVLDFGVAKLMPDSADGAPRKHGSDSLTETEQGRILGTPAYMSPEQARGLAVDKRTDVWAFGCVLFEMLTGRPPFRGDTMTDTLARVLECEPDWTRLPDETPPTLRAVLRRCLRKDSRKRLHDVTDAMLEIDEAEAGSAVTDAPPPLPARRSVRYQRAALALLALLVIAVATLAGRPPREAGVTAPPVHFQLESTGLPLWPAGPPQVSPDGRWLVFVAASNSGDPGTLRVRALDSVEVQELHGTDGAVGPFWSPDSRSIGFHADGAIRRVERTGGAVQVLGQTSAYFGGSWGSDGIIVFGASTGIWQVPATGGAVSVVSPVGRMVRAPHFLPDGRRFLFNEVAASATRPVDGHVFMASLDAPEPIRLIDNALGPWYAPQGYVLFGRDGAVMAQPFDAAAGRLRGEAVPVLSALATDVSFTISSSTTGVLVYVPSLLAPLGGTPVWVDRQGRAEPVAGVNLREAQHPRLSPDGRHLAFVHRGDVWVGDLAGRPLVRLTFDGSTTPRSIPLWTPDGRGVVYEGPDPDLGLWLLPADGSSNIPTRVSPVGHYHPHGWSRDGRELLTILFPGTAPRQIVALPFGEEGETRVVVASAGYDLLGASLSPNGRWLAYGDAPTGRREIWVRPFTGPGPPVRVSAEGGEEPLWAHDGRALFYRQGTRVLSVTVDSGGEFQFEAPVVLFESNHLGSAAQPTWDVAADGRFLMLQPADVKTDAARAVVVTNWMAELSRRSGR
jgi:eukaryotic-like serine/threonine-protein kinase